MPLPKPTRALVRDPSPQYAAFYAPRGILISERLAHAQHDAYAQALENAGLDVVKLPAHPDRHDCVFIEDTAIVWQNQALITRMTALREGEQAETAKWLQDAGYQVSQLPPGARIEGGDVMHLDEVTYVGLTERTNQLGVDALRNFLAPFGRPVEAVPVERCLHLKSAVTYLGNHTVLVSPALVDINLPVEYAQLNVAEGESHAGNALRINDSILFAAGFPKTAAGLRTFAQQHQCKLVELDISEYQKGDGAITCSSIILSHSLKPNR